jgi:threonine dehydratase
MLLERSKLVVEGAGAVALAAVLAKRLPIAGKKVAVVLSGGNIDINLAARLIEHGLTTAGRYLVFETAITDKPGELVKLLGLLLEERVNILSIEHLRPSSFPEVTVLLTVETHDAKHGDRLLGLLRRRGYRAQRVRLGQRNR